MAHGGNATKETLTPVCWEARRRGADCVLLDMLGHGASSPQPNAHITESMQNALDVKSGMDSYSRVVFIGHSLGAALGRGHPYPCDQSVALGQRTECNDARAVWGTAHRTLGLPESAYLLSHALEPWSPSVIHGALDMLLGAAPARHWLLGCQMALAWLSFVVLAVVGLLAAHAIRSVDRLPLFARSVLAVAVFWLLLAVGTSRTLWYLIPSQSSDALVISGVLLMTTVIGAGVQRANIQKGGAPGSSLGSALSALLGIGVAGMLYFNFRHRAVGGVLIFLPMLTLFLAPFVVASEYVSRPKRGCGALESCVFVGGLLGLFIALLFPGYEW